MGRLSSSLVAVGLAVQVGCGSRPTTGPPEGALSIVITSEVPDTLFSIGDSIRLLTRVTDENGAIVTDPVMSFDSSEPGVASVTSGGLVVSRGNGTALVSARTGAATASVAVRVRQKLATVSVDPPSLRIGVTRSRTLAVAPADARGNPMSGPASAAYASSDETVATVDAAGLVSAVAPGVAAVTASISSPADGVRTASAAVTVVVVRNAATVSFGATTFIPGTVDIDRGGTVTFANDSGAAHDVDFGVSTLDIPVHTAGQSARSFAAPGVFPFHCNLHAGMTGVVFVH